MINRYASYLIVNSDYSHQRSLAVGVDPQKIVKVMGGVDCETFRPNPDMRSAGKVNILTAARLVKFKGFEYSIQAVKELLKAGIKEVHYTIVGDGPERANIEELAKDLLGDYVTITGSRRIEDMPTIFQSADIFLHLPVYLTRQERGSSYVHTETMGRCLCEASASGLPIVATEVGGIPEVVEDGKTGFLVLEKDYSGASAALFNLIDNPELRDDIGTKGRLRAETIFSWKVVFERYKQIFEK